MEETILVVEDDHRLRRIIGLMLDQAGYHCELAGTLEEARAVSAVIPVDAAVCDVRMPDGTGLELFPDLAKRAGGRSRVVLMTGEKTTALRAEVAACGAGYLGKPFGAAELISSVEKALST